jgi:hypothetical protein
LTESEWLASDYDDPLYEFIRRKVDRHKLRLFACACCRQIRDVLTPFGRPGPRIVKRQPDPTLRDEVECDEVDQSVP